MEKMIDVHIHLTHEKYEDVDKIIKEAKENGIKNVLLIGCDENEIKKSIELNKKNDGFMKMAAGYHPIEVRNIDDKSLIELETIIKRNDFIIALGEIGLDYHWYPEEKEEQKELFKKQLILAKKLNIPYIVHSREASDDTLEIIKEVKYYNGVMHSFAENYENAKRFLDLGMYISISGPLTFKNGHNQKDVIKNIDINKLLVETDGPFLTPEPFRGKVNHPMYVSYIVEEIANIKGLEVELVKNKLINNTYKVFKEFNEN